MKCKLQTNMLTNTGAGKKDKHRSMDQNGKPENRTLYTVN